FAGLQTFNFPRVVIDADHVVSDVRKARASDEADITRAYNGKVHSKKRRRLSPNGLSRPTRAKTIARFAALCSWVFATRAARIETQIKPELWKRFKCESEQDAIFFDACVVAHNRTN